MKSIGFRLLLVMLAVSLMGMGLVAVFGTALSASAIHEQSLGRVLETTKLKALEIDGWLKSQMFYAEAVAASLAGAPDVAPDAIVSSLVRLGEANRDSFCVYVGYPDGTGVFSDGWAPDYSAWKATERDWYLGAEADPANAYVTDLYQDADTGEFCVTVSSAFIRDGRVAGVLAIDIFTTVLNSVIAEESDEGGYTFMTDAYGNIILHPNSDYAPVVNEYGDSVFKNLSEIENSAYAPLVQSGAAGGTPIRLKTADSGDQFYTASLIGSGGWIVYHSIPADAVTKPITSQIAVSALVFIVALAVSSVIIYLTVRRLVVLPVNDMTAAAVRLARGEIAALENKRYVGEMATLAQSFISIERFNGQLADWLETIAEGDMTVEAYPRGPGDRTGHALLKTVGNLGDLFGLLYQSAAQVSGGSKQISEGAGELALGAAEQSCEVERLSDSVAEILQNTSANAEMAQKAAELAHTIKQNAEKGSRQMNELTSAVREINAASQDISRVIKAIDDIAFQTNILSLNAAVEAARAGYHGKGFAVVAEEVRSLAAKSAKAAKDTGGLIANSMDKAELGSRIAIQTAASLAEIVSGINESTRIVDEIAKSSETQSRGLAQIGQGIGQVARVTTQNSVTAQQSAAASEEMSAQSTLLEELAARFKVHRSLP
jgi:methyl-accepting chemotaxis protein